MDEAFNHARLTDASAKNRYTAQATMTSTNTVARKSLLIVVTVLRAEQDADHEHGDADDNHGEFAGHFPSSV